jgi:hypothetical protein
MSKPSISKETLQKLSIELHQEPLHVKILPNPNGAKRVVFHRHICHEGTPNPKHLGFEFIAEGELALLSNDELVQAVGQAFMCAGFEKELDDDNGS